LSVLSQKFESFPQCVVRLDSHATEMLSSFWITL